MSLIKCPECNKEVSDSIDACIHCGYRLNNAQKENSNNTGKVIVHGYTEWYIYNPKISVYDNNTLLGKIEKNGLWEHTFEQDTTLSFKCMGKVAQIEVKSNEKKEIFLSLDRFTGSLIATSTDNDFSQSNSIIKNYSKEEYQSINSNNINSSNKKNKYTSIVIIAFIIIAIILILPSDNSGNPSQSDFTHAFEILYSDVSNVSCRYKTTHDNFKYYNCTFRHLINKYSLRYSTHSGCATCLYYDNNWTCTGIAGNCPY